MRLIKSYPALLICIYIDFHLHFLIISNFQFGVTLSHRLVKLMNTTPNQNFYSFTYFDRLKMRSTRIGTARNRKLSRPSSLENYSRKQKHNLRLIWLEIISTYQEKGQKRRQWVDQVLSEVIPLINTFVA